MPNPAIIKFDRSRLFQGLPCCWVEGEDDYWDGFGIVRGAVVIKTGDGKAWMEFHGEREWLRRGGLVLEGTGEFDSFGDNIWDTGALDRLTGRLTYGAINRKRVRNRQTSAVTTYRNTRRGLVCSLVPEARLEGRVRSVRLEGAGPGPLSIWLETEDGAVF